MLTLSTTFDTEFSKATVEPILLVAIYTTTGDPTLFCTGSKNISFSSITNPYGGSTGALVANPLVGIVTPIATMLDPFSRAIVRNSVTVSLIPVDAIRDLVIGTRLINRNVVIKLGTAAMTSEADWAPLFNGTINDINARPDGVDLECSDFLRFTDTAHYGTWINKHPLEVVKKLLEEQGVPEEFIDDDMFDPLHADYSDIAHYVVSYYDLIPVIHDPSNGASPSVYWKDAWEHNMGETFSPYASSRLLSETFASVVHDLAKLMVASLYFDELGQVRFLRFSTAAPVRAHWNKDELKGLTQISNKRVNQIDMQISGGRNDGIDAYSGIVQFKDSTSQTNFAFTGESNGVFSQSVSFLQINFHASLGTTIPSSGGFTARVRHPWGLSGTRINTTITYDASEDEWVTSHQDAATLVNSDRPLYVLINQEVLKSVSIDLIDGEVEYPNEYDQDGRGTMKARPEWMDLVVASAGRGQYGTSAQEHTEPLDPQNQGAHSSPSPLARVFDMTMHTKFADIQLQRFSNGCPIIEVYTSLSQWKVQLGDFVTVDDETFLAFGRDGLSSSTTWEVIEKELYCDESSVQVKWKLAYATETSPPTIVGVYGWIDEDLRRGLGSVNEMMVASEAEVGVSRHTVMGLGATSSGLNVTVGTGTAACGNSAVSFNAASTITVPASMDHYVGASLDTGAITIKSVATSAAAPAIGGREVVLAKVVAGGSTCAITDLREYGAVRPRNMSTIDFEQGGNLVPNPDFETWSRGPGYPPDHWELLFPDTQDWIDDFTREETITYSGSYALNMALTFGYVVSSLFRVERDRTYQFGISLKASGVSVHQAVQIQWLTAAKVQVSLPTLISHNASPGTTDMTRYDVSTTAPSTAVYARVYLSKFGTTPGNGIYDSIRMVRSMPSFFATNTTQTIANKATNVIDFDQEVYDYGGSYTAASGIFEAPFAGTYQFHAQVISVTNDDSTSWIEISKNGAILLQSSWANGHQISSGPITLAAGDEISCRFYNGSDDTATITGAATKCWFSGAQIV